MDSNNVATPASNNEPSKDVEEVMAAYLKAMKTAGLTDKDIVFEYVRIVRKAD